MPAPPSRDLAREVGAADEIVEAPHADLRHQLAHLLGHEQQVLQDVLGRAGEAPAQLGILRRDAHGAGVEVADAHHDAARCDERGGREAELLGPEQGADDDVAAGAQPAVDLQADAAAQGVADEHLLGLGEAELPGHAGVPDRGRGGGARAAVHAGDHDVVGARLGDARGDRADARERDELDADLGRRVGAAQVVDQLREVLDRVDVVVRRRRDQADAGRRVAQARDLDVDLVARAAARPRRAWRPARP